jgi:DNA polymerase III subunit epsilon
MREIVLDTETTGLDPKGGHRIVEIGCVELDNHMPTGETYHQYINPERDMPEEAFRIHGLSQEYLSEFPAFAQIAADFVAFVGDAKLIIHNASFDMGFINAELSTLDLEPIPLERATDTVAMARRKFPGARANLDALCQRFGIDNSNRDLHGALLDSRLLADVYLELIGGRQPDLALKSEKQKSSAASSDRRFREPRPHAPTEDELSTHREFIEKLEDAVWTAD